MQSREAFEKDVYAGGKELQNSFTQLVSQAERYQGEKKSMEWHAYLRNKELQERFIEEITRAVGMPKLAPEVIGMRYRLWQEFEASVEAFGMQPTASPVQEEEQDLTIYKDKHPAPPKEDEIVLRKETPKPMLRVKPRPSFTAATPKKMDAMPSKPVAKKVVPTPKITKPPVQMKKTAPDASVEKVRTSIVERVAKKSQGFLDGIFGSLGNEDAGLSKIKDLTLADIIQVEKLSPDAHTAKLDDFGVTQKEWEAWIDWVNESNRVLSATLSETLGEYVEQVATHIARTK